MPAGLPPFLSAPASDAKDSACCCAPRSPASVARLESPAILVIAVPVFPAVGFKVATGAVNLPAIPAMDLAAAAILALSPAAALRSFADPSRLLLATLLKTPR